MKKIKIKSHPNLQPFKNTKVRHSIWGFNEVSFKISTEYVRMYNFRPKELERYNYFIIYAMKKIKIKVIQICSPSRTWKCDIPFVVSTRFPLKFQTCMYKCRIFGRKNLNDTIISLSTLWKNKNKKSFNFAALQEQESATFHLGFQRGFV
jgi:hypothetical protein